MNQPDISERLRFQAWHHELVERRERWKVRVESLLALAQEVIDPTDLQLRFGGSPTVADRLEEGERLTEVLERALLLSESSIHDRDVRQHDCHRRSVAHGPEELPGLHV